MFNTFNMGVTERVVPGRVEPLRNTYDGENPYVIGEITENSDSKIILE